MANMFGKQAYELLQEVATCPAESLPPFNEEMVRCVVDEIKLQHDKLTEVFNQARERHRLGLIEQGLDPDAAGGNPAAWHGTESEATELMVYHGSILRNKRLLFAYVKERAERIRELRWMHRTLPEHVKVNLSPQELSFFKARSGGLGYDRLLSRYMRSGRGGIGLDLTADPVPPEDPCVQVRVLRDYGEVVFSSGKVSLQRGKSHWLPRDEVHPLVMDGVLELVPSDSVVLPALLSGIFHACWVAALIVFAAIAGWPRWSGCERGFPVLFAGMLGAMGANLLLDAALAVASVQGTPFETSKRWAVVPLLYAATLPLVAQLAFTALGVELFVHGRPTDCWPPSEQAWVRRMAEGLTWSTLSFLSIALLGVILTYNLFEQHHSDPREMAEQWIARCSCIAGLLCCREQVWHTTEGKRPPIHNMAELTAGLLSHVDLDATDVMAALVLTSAAQNRRRRLRIAKALLPVAQALRIRVAAVSSQAESSVDGGEEPTSDELDDASSTTSINDVPTDWALERALRADAGRHTAAAADLPAAAASAGPEESEAAAAVAARAPRPLGKSVHWLVEAQQSLLSPEEEHKEQPLPPEEQKMSVPRQQGPEAAEPAGSSVPLTRENLQLADRLSVEAAAELVAGQLLDALPKHVPDYSPQIVEQLASAIEDEVRALGGGSALPQDVVLTLAKASLHILGILEESMDVAMDVAVLEDQESSIWLRSVAGSHHDKGSELERQSPLAAKSPFATAGGAKSSDHSALSTVPPTPGSPPAPALAHAAAVDQAAAVVSEVIAGEPPPASEDEAAAVAAVVAGARSSGSSSAAGTAISEHMSMHRQLSLQRQPTAKYPTLITPSEHVEAFADTGRGPLPVDAIVEIVAGRHERVESEVLHEAQHWLSFAYAVYSLQPRMAEPASVLDVACFKPPDPLQASRAVVLKGLGELEQLEERSDVDILHLNASNRVLAHLPYALFLDRGRRAVVLAIRGTLSIADIVTDSVVEPTSLGNWLPDDVKTHLRDQPAFAHAGMLAAAKAIFRDMRERGILQPLAGKDGQDDQEQWRAGDGGGRGSGVDQGPGRRTGELIRKKIEEGFQFIVCGHSLGAGAAALESLAMLRTYWERRGSWRALPMFPPGRVLFLRPLKSRAKKEFDAVWVAPEGAAPAATAHPLPSLLHALVLTSMFHLMC
eukprot:scaffold11.g3991.t1